MADAIPIIDIPFTEKPKVGEMNHRLAFDTIKSIKMATKCCMIGDAAGLCTNPINKFVLSSGANFKHTGHTDFLKDLTNSKQSIMMIASCLIKRCNNYYYRFINQRYYQTFAPVIN